MIKETIEKNAEVKVNSKEMEVLQKHFPSCFDKDGKFDIKVFEELIKTEDVDIKKEGYSLDFLGKSYARYLASLDSETVIVPDEGNKDINSENIYIVGDNLDALQHLKYSYSERIKCIYIDPPYNTGSDGFVYNDKFEFTAEELAKKIGIEQEEAERVLNMQGKSTHSAWLTFMYPRLELARDLLSDDGVIFISIDDNEKDNAKLLCDLIFGEGNYVGTFTVNSTPNARDYGHIGKQHEYVLFYTKKKESAETFLIKQKEKKFKYKDEVSGFNIHPLYNSNEAFTNENRPNLFYPFYLYLDKRDGDFYEIGLERKENSVEIYPPKSEKNDVQFVWRWGKEKSLNFMNKEIIGYKTEDGEYRIVQKMRHDAKLIRSILDNKEFTSRKGTSEVEELLGEKIFSFPKPLELIKTLITVGIECTGIVLDFFSGSGTTAEAVMRKNLEDSNLNSDIKYIMVQIDENYDELYSKAKKAEEKNKYGKIIGFLDSINKPHVLSEIGRERIRRAAKKIAEENPEKAESLDLGFKTYYLKSTDKQTLDKIVDFDPNMPLDAEDIKSKFGKDTIIETWKIKDGYGFNAEVKEIDLKGYTAYFLTDSKVGTSLYLIDDMPDNAIVELVRKIEAYELNVDRIIEYGYAFSHATNTALRSNLKTLKNRNAIEPIIRY